MTLIELIVSFLVLGLSFAIYVSTAVAVRRQSVSVQDLSIASDACQRVVETLRSEPFDELVRRYGVDPDDDPNGAGTAPGAKFTVAGLHPALDDPDGIVGEVVLPELEVQS
ncbi:MAG: hypothetical protein IT453_20015, partial [Planctomycetes bacterium]|nr:hypothetical protein [Planctomycetota bacterium]